MYKMIGFVEYADKFKDKIKHYKLKRFLAKTFPALWRFNCMAEIPTIHFLPIVTIQYYYHKYILKQPMNEFMN